MSAYDKNKVYIWPCDGIAEGETEIRTVPLCGLFAVKNGRACLDRAMNIWESNGIWNVLLDGYFAAKPNENWKLAFGQIYKSAAKYGVPILLGRKISISEYRSLVFSRNADAQMGVDVAAKFDINKSAAPF